MTDTAGDGLTLRQILFERGSDAELRAVMDGSGATEAIEQRLDALPPRLRGVVIEELVTVIANVLGERLVDVLAAGWQKWEGLTDAARRSLEPPGPTEIVELADHRITSTHEPGFDVTFDGVKVAEVRMEIEIAIVLHALTAVVTHGRLSALRSGRADVSVEVSLDGKPLPPATREVDLTVEIGLGEGIPLVPEAADPILPPAPADQPTTTG